MYKEQKAFRNCTYSLNQTEYESMKQLGSTTVKLSSTNGIGVKVECWDGTDWVDITDYTNW